jgi:hypothetical protein
VSTHTTVVCVIEDGKSGKAQLGLGEANCIGKTQLTVYIP